MELLRCDVVLVVCFFKEIWVGNLLFYLVEDVEVVVDIFGVGKLEKGSVVFVGYGIYIFSIVIYVMIDYMLKVKGLKNFYVGIIEGYFIFDIMFQ